MTSPFPGWITKWSTQTLAHVPYGVKLLSEGDILATSFTCNAWDSCWSTEHSDELARWVEAKQVPWKGSGGSSVPSAKLEAVADIVVKALPHLTEAGVPVVFALRAMAAAVNAISRSRSDGASHVRH